MELWLLQSFLKETQWQLGECKKINLLFLYYESTKVSLQPLEIVIHTFGVSIRRVRSLSQTCILLFYVSSRCYSWIWKYYMIIPLKKINIDGKYRLSINYDRKSFKHNTWPIHLYMLNTCNASLASHSLCYIWKQRRFKHIVPFDCFLNLNPIYKPFVFLKESLTCDL